MNVTDDVERPGLIREVVEQLGPFDADGIDLLDRRQHVHIPEALALQTAQPSPQLLPLPRDHMRAERPVRASLVTVETNPLRRIQHDRDRQYVVLARQGHQLLTRFRLHVRRVDDGQPPGREPFARDVVEYVERVLRRRLLVLVIGDEPAAEVARDHLSSEKVPPREVDLPEPLAPTSTTRLSAGTSIVVMPPPPSG